MGVGFKSNLPFGPGAQWLGPNHAKLCFVLPILKYNQAPDFDLATDRTQPNSAPAYVEGMDQLGIGFARNAIAGNPYRQHRLRSVETPLIARR